MRIISDENLFKIAKPFKYIEKVILILYIIVYIGLITNKPIYLQMLITGFHTFICLFLLYKFNPFRTHTLNQNDGKIIFASALFMLTNLGITEIVKNALNIRIA